MTSDVDDVAARAVDDGLALNSAGRPVRAAARFRAALRRLGPGTTSDAYPSGVRSAEAYLRGRALLGLAAAEFELGRDLRSAEDRLEDAERWATAAGEARLLVAIDGQRGFMRMRAGDSPGALSALDRAVDRLADAEPVDACRVLLNRGYLRLDLGLLDGARTDLRASVERATQLGDAMRLFKARHNLGYLEYLAGDLPAALRAMGEAAAVDAGVSLGVALLDRARVLLEAGLVTEADALLAEAAALVGVERAVLDLAQVELTRADCALLSGHPADALRWARSARRRLRRRGNTAWTVRAELVACQAELAALLDGAAQGAGGRAWRSALLALAERSEELGVARDRHAEAPAIDPWLVRAALVSAAEARAAAGDVDGARTTLRRIGRQTGREPVAVGVQQRLVRARVALALGDRAAARRQVRSGQQLLAEHRRQLGSVEAVAAAAVHGARLVALDVGAALETGRPDSVLDAVERGRATFAGPARVRPPDDPVTAELLSELRQCLERRRALPPAAAPAVLAEREALRRQAARLRAEVRERSWRLGEGVEAPVAVERSALRSALRAADDGTTLVDLITHDGRLHAVVVDADRSRLVALGPMEQVVMALRRVRADFAAQGRPLPVPMADVVRRSLDSGLARLDDLLLGPLGVDGPLHVVASGALLTVPWSVLPSRRGLRTEVGERVVLAGPGEPGGIGVTAIAGPGLVHAESEVDEIGRRWADAEVLRGEDARCATARERLGTHAVVHLAAHGHHQTENPLFSWVQLADGPLFAHELEGMTVPGSVVVLSACEVGRVSERLGGTAVGMASVLLRLGASVVVAALAPLRDDVAGDVMPVLHGLLSAGHPPGVALAEVCAELDEPVPVSCFAGALR